MSTTTLIVVLLAVLVGIPLLTFVHELGHALVAALLVGGPVLVLQGPEPRRFAFSTGRLAFRLHGPVSPRRSWVGWAVWPAHPSRLRHSLALAGGPAASGVAACVLAATAAHMDGATRAAFVVLAADAGLQALSSALPVRYPSFSGSYAGAPSDGLKIRRLLGGRPAFTAAEAARHRGRALPAPTARDRAAEA